LLAFVAIIDGVTAVLVVGCNGIAEVTRVVVPNEVALLLLSILHGATPMPAVRIVDGFAVPCVCTSNCPNQTHCQDSSTYQTFHHRPQFIRSNPTGCSPGKMERYANTEHYVNNNGGKIASNSNA